MTKIEAVIQNSKLDAVKSALQEIGVEGMTVSEHVSQMSATMGEKIELGRVVRYETADGVLDGYKHIQNERGTIGVRSMGEPAVFAPGSGRMWVLKKMPARP